jgi:hypothetical protein
MIANIASDDALILPHRANPAGLNFRERRVHWDQTDLLLDNRCNGGSDHQVMVLPSRQEWFHQSLVDSNCHPAAL